MDISQKNSIKRINQIVNHLANTDVECKILKLKLL